jgi:hypothetical protein
MKRAIFRKLIKFFTSQGRQNDLNSGKTVNGVTFSQALAARFKTCLPGLNLASIITKAMQELKGSLADFESEKKVASRIQQEEARSSKKSLA